MSLLTGQELKMVSQGLGRVYPIGTDLPFDDLLRAIDVAEQCHLPITTPVRRS